MFTISDSFGHFFNVLIGATTNDLTILDRMAFPITIILLVIILIIVYRIFTVKIFNEDNSYNCIICLKKKRELVFLYCGHVCCCKSCFEKLPLKSCPICEKNIIKIHPIKF